MVVGLPRTPVLRFGFPGRRVWAHGCMLSHFSRVQLLVILWTVACWAPLFMEFSRQAYWSGLPFPSPGYLPYSGIEPRSPALQADSLPTEPLGKPQAGNGLPSNHCCMPTMCLPEEFAAFPSRLISFNFSASSISSPSQKQP